MPPINKNNCGYFLKTIHRNSEEDRKGWKFKTDLYRLLAKCVPDSSLSAPPPVSCVPLSNHYTITEACLLPIVAATFTFHMLLVPFINGG